MYEYTGIRFSFRNLGILICLHTGLRIGEICALQWKDLDMTAGVLHVGKTLSRIYLSDGEEQEYYLSIGATALRRDVLKASATTRPCR